VRSVCATAVFLGLFAALAARCTRLAAEPPARKTVISIRDGDFLINGRPTYEGRHDNGLTIEGLLFNSRMVQGIFDDLNPDTRALWAYPDTGTWDAERNTREFVAAMPEWRKNGLLCVTLNLQGGNPRGYSRDQPWRNSAIEPDGTLRAAYLARLEQILDAADDLGMVAILGIFYFGQDQFLEDDAAVFRAVDGTVDWIYRHGYRHVLVEINNECNVRYDHAVLRPDRVHELIERVKSRKRPGASPGELDRLLVSTSYGGNSVPKENVVRAADYLLMHGNGVSRPERIAEMVRQARQVAGYRPMPIVFNEDDHFDFDKPANNLLAATGEHASWGFFDPGKNNYVDGYQSPPVNWSINTPRKREFFGSLARITSPQKTSAVYPAKTWTAKRPEEVALDSKGLDAMARYIGGIGCVVRGGYLVFRWGQADKRADVASACKPWFTHFLFTAIEQGKLKSVDDPLVAVEPRLSSLNAALGHKDRDIRWRHLASQTSCYGVEEKPGEAYDYSDFNMALFFDSLFFRVYGSTADRVTPDILRPQLTDVLECEDHPKFNDRGRLAISPRDFARFGLLYLHEGNWRGRQLISREHVREILTSPLANSIPRTQGKRAEMIPRQRSLGGGSNQTDHLGSYSFAWWTNGVDRDGRRHWPAAPSDTFAALGHFGRRALVVIPSRDLIVVWNESLLAGPEMEDRALHLLLQACLPPEGANPHATSATDSRRRHDL
jgi:CubicO group peptidase (beta-lactamase class C family)